MNIVFSYLKRINETVFLKYYLLIYFTIMLTYIGINGSSMVGEWDDYSLPSASIINNLNFTISENDIEFAKKLFPEWESSIDNYSLSPYTARNGEKMTWYFPLYSLICIPLILSFKILGIPTSNAFSFTNLFVLMTALFIVYKNSKLNDRQKILSILMLSINPILFYLTWISAEVFIFSILTIGVLFWILDEKKKAAIFVSIAGMLNPTILCIGIVMIIEFIYTIWIQDNNSNSINRLLHMIKYWKKIICYGCCYTIALIPMIYNLYNTGHINLTSSLSRYTTSETKPIERFFAYLFDLNFGIFPYYNFIFILFIFYFLISIIKKKMNYIKLCIAFFMTIYSYSFMTHINCGMSGIARYNAWSSVLMLLAVSILTDEIWKKKFAKNIVMGSVITTILLLNIILYKYDIIASRKAPYTFMSPIAEWTLNIIPEIYNPLHSTFASRILHIDGGYSYETPIIYSDSNDNIRKILAQEKDKEYLLNNLNGNDEDYQWFIKKVNKLNTEDYISIPKNRKLKFYRILQIDEKIIFAGEKRNAENYVNIGLSKNENGFSWTDSNYFKMSFHLKNFTKKYATSKINLLGIFNNKQKIAIYINQKEVFNESIHENNISFTFEIPENGIIDFEMYLPDAISPKQLGMSNDIRLLALQLVDMTIQEIK